MTEKSSAIAIEPSASPLATVQEIQRPLIRPSSHCIQPHASIISSTSEVHRRDHPQNNENSLNRQQIGGRDNERGIIGADNKLEDYLDPYLLQITASKISRANVARTNLKVDASVVDSELPAGGFGLSSFDWERSKRKRRRIQGD